MAISNWQLAKPTPKPLTTKGHEGESLKLGEIAEPYANLG
jgi:hypothetical protein